MSSIVDLRPGEGRITAWMFAYAFAAMTAYNIVQPVTRSTFITDLGADNLPYVLLATGFVIGLIMQGYARIVATLPERWALPSVQLTMAVVLAAFFVLLQIGGSAFTVAFYVFGQILGTLLLSQFWTLANDLYDPRQARRLFGFIGGGVSLGGMAGSGFAALVAGRIGTAPLLLFSTATLVGCAAIVTVILRQTAPRNRAKASPGSSPAEANDGEWTLVRQSANLRSIAMLISLAAVAAMVVDQQLSLAAEQVHGGDEDAVTGFLASVRFFLSAASLLIQLVLVRHIYRLLGIGVAVMMLPVALGASSVLILMTGAIWAAAVASTIDRSIRYTVDRTTREILFLPLDSSVRLRVKSFVDVTVDRGARAAGALLVLVAIKPWGLALSWPRLSVITLTLVAVWLVLAVRARDRYVAAIRRGLELQAVKPDEVSVGVADLTTVEALLEELAHPDERRVLYAIDVLDSLDKQSLVTPLLLHHESAAVRARALGVIGTSRSELSAKWQPLVQRMVNDPDPEVRANAILTLAKIEGQDAAQLARTLLGNATTAPRMAISAAVVVAGTGLQADVAAARLTLTRLVTDPQAVSTETRVEVARAIRYIDDRETRDLLIPLLQDRNIDVAEQAMASVRGLDPLDHLFVPTLISLLGHRRLKSGARDALVRYGESVLPALGQVMSDADEDIWVRRHVPATLAQIPCQPAMDLLVGTLDDPDGFLRFKAIAGMETLTRRDRSLQFPFEPVNRLVMREAVQYFEYLTHRDDVFVRGGLSTSALLARVLTEKMERSVDRTYRLIALLHPGAGIPMARWAINHGDPRTRAQAFELLDNTLAGTVRQVVMPMLEDLPGTEAVKHAHTIRRTHPGSAEDALLALINDHNEVVAAAAIDLVRSEAQWNLVDDVEHVLAHRDARDWLVFEAASWTLADHRISAEKRQARWLEPLPAIVLVDRVRHLPMFASVDIEELSRLAARGRQVRHAHRSVLLEEGVVPEAFYLLLDGRVSMSTRSTDKRHMEGPALIGFEAALQGRSAGQTAVADGTVVTVAIEREALLTVLAGSTDLVRGLLRTVADLTDGARWPVVVRGTSRDKQVAIDVNRPTPIQKMLALQQVPVLADLPPDEISHLAAIARPEPITRGSTLADEGDPPSVMIVLSGSIVRRMTVDRPDSPVVLPGPLHVIGGDSAVDDDTRAKVGDTLGFYETLAGTSRAPASVPVQIVAEEQRGLLRFDRDELFDLMGQRPELLQHFFGTLSALRSR